jgi:type I restriction enzyme S subunit
MNNGQLSTVNSPLVKPGYKRTNVGVIPEDWGQDSICNLASITTGAKNTQDKIEDGEYPFFVRSPIVERINSYSFDGEAILTAGDGVGTGKIFHYIDGKFDFHQRVYRISNFSIDLDGYFFYLYFSTHFYDRIMSMTARSSVDSVRMEMIADMIIPLPPLPEQRAIAAVLSDVDALITALDRLIAKKRAIKQGAMQQLLTGKKRLPGFSGEWEVKNLGDVSEIKTGKKNNEDKVENGAYPFFVRSQTVERINTYSFDGEAVLVPGEGGIGSIFHYINGKFDYHQRVYKISDFSNDICGNFIYFCMLQNFGKQATRNSVKATVDSLRLPTFQEFEFIVPSLEEQRAIATVLSDMDAEIAALEAHRDKTRVLKQGMMQELLTGRIRLVG